MIQFYAPDIAVTRLLPPEESQHCCRVLRKKEGDEISVVDGRGRRYRCVIVEAHAKHTAVEILDVESEPERRDYSITLAVAPTKNMDRMEWLLEKSVELGVDRFVPLICQRSERRVIKHERLHKIALSAMNQSLKSRMPQVEEAQSFDKFIAETTTPGRFFGYCHPDLPKQDFLQLYKRGDDVTILIGPEGDFSPEEVEKAIANRFEPVTLGPERLRTETAALYALTATHVVNRIEN